MTGEAGSLPGPGSARSLDSFSTSLIHWAPPLPFTAASCLKLIFFLPVPLPTVNKSHTAKTLLQEFILINNKCQLKKNAKHRNKDDPVPSDYGLIKKNNDIFKCSPSKRNKNHHNTTQRNLPKLFGSLLGDDFSSWEYAM